MTDDEIAKSELTDDAHEGHAAANSHLVLPLALIAIFAVVLLIVSSIKNAKAHSRIRDLEGGKPAPTEPVGSNNL